MFIRKDLEVRLAIWGGSIVENVVQALARIIIGEQMIRINERYKTCLDCS